MPALPTIPNALRARVLFDDGADLSVGSTLFFSYSGGPPDDADALALATAIYTEAAAEFPALLDSESAVVGVEVTDLSSDTTGQATYSHTTAGTRAGGVLAGGTAMLVNHVIARRYRGGRPRNYFPFMTTSDLANRQEWNAPALSAVNTAFAAFISGVLGASSGSTTITDHINVSYYQGFTVVTSPTTGRARNVPKLRTTPLVSAILSSAASARPSSQRRRN